MDAHKRSIHSTAKVNQIKPEIRNLYQVGITVNIEDEQPGGPLREPNSK